METEKKNKLVEFIGFISGALTSLSFFPQVILVWKMKPAPAAAISLPMYVMFCLGICGWLVYGNTIRSRPIMFWNTVTLTLAFSVLVYKCIYG